MVSPADSPQINCPHCGAPLEAGLPACPLCGTPLPGPAGLPSTAPRPDYPPPAAPIQAAFPVHVYPPPPGLGAAPPPALAAPPGARRPGLWIGLALGLGLALCLVVFLGGGALLAVSGGRLFAAPTPTPLDPTALLDEATAAQDQTKAVHYIMTGEINGQSAQSSGRLTLEGDVVPPDSYTMHSDQYGDRIVIGQDVYVREQGSTAWQKSLEDANAQADPTANPTALLDFLKYYNPDSVVLQDDVISGTQRLHFIRFEVDVERMAASEGAGSPGAALLGADVQGTVRVDATTHLIDRLTLLIAAPNSGTATLTIQLSRQNVPVTITPPATHDQ